MKYLDVTDINSIEITCIKSMIYDKMLVSRYLLLKEKLYSETT